jgi:hypothetical protein
VTAKDVEVDHAALERQLATVEGKLTKAKRRLVEVDNDLLDVVQDEVRRLRGEQERLQAAIRAARTPRQTLVADVLQQLDSVIARLNRLRDVVQEGDPAKVREFMRQAIERVEVHAACEKHGKRHLYRLQRGSIYLRGDDLHNLSRLSARRGLRNGTWGISFRCVCCASSEWLCRGQGNPTRMAMKPTMTSTAKTYTPRCCKGFSAPGRVVRRPVGSGAL